jgi:hypothetical protein
MGLAQTLLLLRSGDGSHGAESSASRRTSDPAPTQRRDRPCRARPADPVPGRGGPERRRRPRPDGTGPLVRAGSVAHRDRRGTSGHQRSPTSKRSGRPTSLQLKQLAQRQPANQIVVPKVGGSSPLGHPPLSRGSGRSGPTQISQRAAMIGWSQELPLVSGPPSE